MAEHGDSAGLHRLPRGSLFFFGSMLFVLNCEVIAPRAFPWFETALRLITAADHALFGAVAAAVCVLLRSPRR
jgi:hypothetical protein